MKIKIEMEIENCYNCPFIRKIYEQGYCATVCDHIMYGEIPKKGIRKDCPFSKKGNALKLTKERLAEEI